MGQSIGGAAKNWGLKATLSTTNGLTVRFDHHGTDRNVKFNQNINYRAQKWWPVAVTSKNTDTTTNRSYTAFFIKTDQNNTRQNGYEFMQYNNTNDENVDISTLTITYCADSATGGNYWNGKVYEMVFIGKYFEATSWGDLNWLANYHVPKPIYIVDFMEPYTTQSFRNYAASGGYLDVVNGQHDHSDYKDFKWNAGAASWSMRSYVHYLQFPTFNASVGARMNKSFQINMKIININTSIGSVFNYWDFYNRWSANFGTRKYGLNAYHFSNSNVRI
jgi:hypothetical protein